MRVLSSDSASRHAAPVSRTARPLRSRRACLVLPGDSVRMVAKARQRSEDEQNYLRRLRAGETTVQILGLTPHPSRNG